MNKELIKKLRKIPYYHYDGRASLAELYTAYNKLALNSNWIAETVFTQQLGPVEIPMLCLRTKQKGIAVWAFAGVHGEEPAGPNAFANCIDLLTILGEKIPVVLFPLCNPLGYSLNWRYQNEYRDPKVGHSVGDSDHLLLDSTQARPRLAKPTSHQCGRFSRFVISLLPDYPAKYSVDHHEDEDLKRKNKNRQMYIYSQGRDGANDIIAQQVVALIEKHGFHISRTGITRFGENIVNGVVVNKEDGSIDELLATDKIFSEGKVIAKSPTRSVITVETPTYPNPLRQRIRLHEAVIELYENFYKT